MYSVHQEFTYSINKYVLRAYERSRTPRILSKDRIRLWLLKDCSDYMWQQTSSDKHADVFGWKPSAPGARCWQLKTRAAAATAKRRSAWVWEKLTQCDDWMDTWYGGDGLREWAGGPTSSCVDCETGSICCCCFSFGVWGKYRESGVCFEHEHGLACLHKPQQLKVQ